jgi:hypothetical protein
VVTPVAVLFPVFGSKITDVAVCAAVGTSPTVSDNVTGFGDTAVCTG